MADRSNYADRPTTDEDYMPPGGFPLNFGARTYDPTAGADDGEGSRSNLFESSLGGDWSWKPARDKALGEYLRTFRGVPPSAAELYRHTMHQPG
ncbi:MAG TPA: hypothetical protein VGW33_14385 [Terriglobia bacterium]|nr:hypothetical protein [Terriglobia bacterium]